MRNPDRAFFSRGAKLHINGRCDKNGYILAEIRDIFDEPWEGFGREDCVAFEGDAVDHAFEWRGSNDINMVPGYTRICFHLKNAQLFSFRISDD